MAFKRRKPRSKAPWEATTWDITVSKEQPCMVLEDMRELLMTRCRQGQWEPPLMPTTARQAMDMARNPEASFGGIAAVLETDPVLTAQVLKLANSPAFGGSQRISGLRQALVRIGLRGFGQLLMLVSIGQLLTIPGSPGATLRLQEHTTAVAISAEQLAMTLGLDRDTAFTAGVLHDIGVPMAYGLMIASRRYLPREVARSPRLQAQIAQALHEELGAELAKRWRLPSELATALGHHHDPGSGPSSHQMLTWVLAAASHVVDEAEIHSDEGSEPAEGLRAFEALGLPSHRVSEFAARTRHRLGLPPVS